MSRTVYLIDSENVASHWVGHIKFASAQDRLIIFWSRNCKGLPFGALEQFLELYPKEQIEFVECYTGSNSIDFHIVAKLGQLMARAPKTHFAIVSEDTGKVFITEHPEVASYRKEVTEILSSTVYPSKRNSVIIYEQMIKLPGTKEAKMAAIYRSMKKELLPAIDNVICPS